MNRNLLTGAPMNLKTALDDIHSLKLALDKSRETSSDLQEQVTEWRNAFQIVNSASFSPLGPCEHAFVHYTGELPFCALCSKTRAQLPNPPQTTVPGS